jgi:hypothetical protein
MRLARTGTGTIEHFSEHIDSYLSHLNLPEVPPSNNRLSAVLTTEDLVVQSLGAVIIAKVEGCLGVLVLDNKLEADVVVAPWTHGFQLEGSIIAGKHPATIVASIVSKCSSLLLVEPSCAITKALGFGELDAKGHHTAEGSDDCGGLHVDEGVGWCAVSGCCSGGIWLSSVVLFSR